MIGTKLRGIRHLWRLAEASTLGYILTKSRERDYDVCEFIKTPVDFPKGEKMIIFNHYVNHNSDIYREITSEPSLSSKINGIEHCRVLGIYKNHKTDTLQGYNQFFSEITLLPYSFKEDYASFLKENSKMVKSIETKYNISLASNSLAKAMYVFTNGSKNFFQWAINLYYNQGVSAETIKLILQWNDNYAQLTKNLSKGTITAYTTRDSLATLLDELGDLRNKKRINDSINSFNTTQKKLLKSRELTDKENKALSRFAKLSETKRLNFIKKVSSIEDIDELMRQLKHVTSTHFDWTKESFMEYITNVDGINHEIIVDNGDIVLTKVNDYETIKQFGKTTNWCISKNKSYWNNYVEHHNGKTTQYMLFNFSRMEDDKLSIVGLTTTHNKGITSAHNFVNDNLMKSNTKSNELLKSFISKFKNNNDIYSVLSDCGIDISSIVHFDRPCYKWDMDSLMEYLFECVDHENVDIIKDGLSDDNKLVLSIRDENIRYFLGDAYTDNVSEEYWGNQHILFIDFAKSQYDPNKLQFSIIFDGELGDDYVNGLYNELGNPVNNEDFDSKIIEFGLPYDVIRRSSNKYSMLVKAFANHNMKLLRDYISKDKELLKAVIGEIDEESIYSIIYDSVLNYYSFDYLNLIYDNGYILSDFLDLESVMDFLGKALRKLIEYTAIIHDTTLMSPSSEMIEKFYEDKLDTMEEALYVGTYLQLKMMLDHEQKNGMKYNSLYYGLMTNFNRGMKRPGTLTDEVMLFVIERISFKNDGETLRLCITNGFKYGSDEVKGRIAERSKESKIATEVYESVLKAFDTPKKKVTFEDIYSTVVAASL